MCPKMHGQICNLAVQHRDSNHFFQIFTYNSCGFKHMWVFPLNILTQRISQLNSIMISVHGCIDMHKQIPFQILSVFKIHAGNLLKLCYKGLCNPIYRFINDILENIIRSSGDSCSQKMERKINSLQFFQFRIMSAYQMIFC